MRQYIYTMLTGLLFLHSPWQVSEIRGQTIPGSFSTENISNSVCSAIAANALNKHLVFAESNIVSLLQGNLTNARGIKSGCDQALKDNALTLGLAQSAFIRRCGQETLFSLIQKEGSYITPFIREIMCNRDLMESFVSSIKSTGEAGNVLKTWSSLWNRNQKEAKKYANLSLACALVFVQPVTVDVQLDSNGVVRVEDRYDFFLKADKENKLRIRLPDLRAWELTYVVDAPVPNSELEWAQNRIHPPQAKWSTIYDMVRYRMDKVVGGVKLYDKYSLEEILKKGGVCGDRAYFASITAKANGIPAIALSGQGQRGGHAWFAYKASFNEWNLSAGRYEGDRYATGYYADSQTRERTKEHSLTLLTDKQRQSPEYDKATRLIWLADIFSKNSLGAQAGGILEYAVSTSSRHEAACDAYINWLKDTNAPLEKWKTVIRDMRNSFKGFPDRMAMVDKLETDVLLDPADVGNIFKSLHSQVSQLKSKDKNRSDLIVETIQRHVALLESASKTNAVESVYLRAIKEFGDEKTVLKSLSRSYFDFSKKNEMAEKAVDNIDRNCRRYYSTLAGDLFEVQAQIALMNMVADFYKEAGNDRKAEYLRKKSEAAMKRINSSHKFDR